MSLRLGNQDVTKVMLGDQEVSAVYKGTEEVWSSSGEVKGAWGVKFAGSQDAIWTFDRGTSFPTNGAWTVEVWYKNTGTSKSAYDALFGLGRRLQLRADAWLQHEQHVGRGIPPLA